MDKKRNLVFDMGETFALCLALEVMCEDIKAGCCPGLDSDLRSSLYSARSKVRGSLKYFGIEVTNNKVTRLPGLGG